MNEAEFHEVLQAMIDEGKVYAVQQTGGEIRYIHAQHVMPTMAAKALTADEHRTQCTIDRTAPHN